MSRRTTTLTLIALAIIFLLTTLKSSEEVGTTFSVSPNGAKALFDLFTEAGLETARWLDPFSELDQLDSNGVMFVIAPKTFGNESSLVSWVDNGNTLVVFDSGTKELAPLRTQLGISFTDDFETPKSLFATAPFPAIPFLCPAGRGKVCGDVHLISTRYPQPSFSHRSSATVVAGSAASAKALYLARPSGGAIWWFSQAEPALNQNLDLHDNAQLLYGLAADAEFVAIDEFHHGYTAPLGTEVTRRLEMIYAFLGCVSLWLVLGAISRFVRFGAPTPTPREHSSAAVDFVAVMGLLYEDRRAASVLKNYIISWHNRFARSISASLTLTPDELLSEALTIRVLSKEEASKAKDALQHLREATDYTRKDFSEDVTYLERIIPTALGRQPDGKQQRSAA